ncbi:MAG: glycosyltransferase family 2 protein [Candidatus Sericytochromatia bacterium]|nr:glycosyltransferase family 2 protein [Candidatus Sericytochromatia bacterium]
MLPRVALLVVTLDGRDHLERLLASVADLDYPKDALEIVVVDNGSTDGTTGWLAECHPRIRVLRLETNEGFARPNNLAAALVPDADYLALLNNDMKVDPGWLREALAGFAEPDVACVATRILNWDGTRVDYAGAGMTFDGFGLQPAYGADAERVRGEPGPVLFACGGAMVIRRDVFLALGGFDEAFFAYFEDVDLGWRLWAAGHRVVYRPEAVVRHVHNGTSARFPSEAKRLLMERNALQMVLKNAEDSDLEAIGTACTLLTATRAAFRGNTAEDSFRMGALPRPLEATGGNRPGLAARLRRALAAKGFSGLARAATIALLRRALRHLEPGAAPVKEGKVSIPAEAWAGVLALRDVAAMWPDLARRREAVQALRRRPDRDILMLMQHPLMAVEGHPAYLAIHQALVAMPSISGRYATDSRPSPTEV